jgi:hypothetical protein
VNGRPGRIHHVVDLRAEHAPYGFKQQPAALQAGMGQPRLAAVLAKSSTSSSCSSAEQARAHAVVDVVRVVGDFIGQVGELRFQAGLLPVRAVGGLLHKAAGHAAGLARLDAGAHCACEQCLRMPSRVSKLRFRPL